MNLTSNNQSLTSKSEIKFMLKPILMLTSLIILFLILIIFGTKKITEIRTQITESKRLETVLGQKVSVLESIPEVLAGDTTFLDVALPSRGAVLYGLSQVKNLASTNSLLISNLKTSSQIPEKDEISKIAITFDVEGEEKSVYAFLNSFSKVLPLMNLEKVKIDRAVEGLKASATVNVYTAALPKKIQTVSEKTAELTKADIDTIKEISNYGIPQFIEPKPFEGEIKPDPFN